MIFVDSSVWVDYFRGTASPQADRLDALLQTEPLLIGDIVLTEVLQGFASDRQFAQALALMSALECVVVGGPDIAVEAARHFRTLRARGITVRKMIDTLIATRCIAEGWALLYSDRDFDPFVAHLGLASAMAVA
ncbi:MAG: PIN domain nuclease [Sphingomonas sp.]|uniref:type II toxin-antitoxin system VapC family toxin n=1 Tax=Sphingomonas sp. TaxID=28214 RepID=UPI0035647096